MSDGIRSVIYWSASLTTNISAADWRRTQKSRLTFFDVSEIVRIIRRGSGWSILAILCLSLFSHDEGDIENVLILLFSTTDGTNNSSLCLFLWAWKERQKRKIINVHIGRIENPRTYLWFIYWRAQLLTLTLCSVK